MPRTAYKHNSNVSIGMTTNIFSAGLPIFRHKINMYFMSKEYVITDNKKGLVYYKLNL